MLSRKRKQSQRQQWSKTATKYHPPPPQVVLLPRLPRPYHQKTFTLAVNHPQAAPQPTSTPSPPPPSPPPPFPLLPSKHNRTQHPLPFSSHPTNPQRQTPQLPTPNSQLLRWVVDGIRANIKGIKIFKKKKNPNPLHSRHFLKALVDL